MTPSTERPQIPSWQQAAIGKPPQQQYIPELDKHVNTDSAEYAAWFAARVAQ